MLVKSRFKISIVLIGILLAAPLVAQENIKIINDPKALKKEITDKCRGSAL